MLCYILLCCFTLLLNWSTDAFHRLYSFFGVLHVWDYWNRKSVHWPKIMRCTSWNISLLNGCSIWVIIEQKQLPKLCVRIHSIQYKICPVSPASRLFLYSSSDFCKTTSSLFSPHKEWARTLDIFYFLFLKEREIHQVCIWDKWEIVSVSFHQLIVAIRISFGGRWWEVRRVVKIIICNVYIPCVFFVPSISFWYISHQAV